jgi:hypothetical protein
VDALFPQQWFNVGFKKSSAVSPQLKEAIYLNFRGILNQFADDYPLIHSQKSDKASAGWADTIYEMAGTKLGTVHDVEKMSAKNMLYLMEKTEADRQRHPQTP